MLVVLMLLSLLGLGIGLGTINPAEESNPLDGLGTGAIIWWIISNIVAVFTGAFVASKLTNLPFKTTGILHGLVTWSLYTLISFWLLTSTVGGILSGVGSVVSKTLSGVGQGVSELMSTQFQQDQTQGNELFDKEQMENMVRRVLARETDTTVQQIHIEPAAIARELFLENGEIKTDVQRQEIVDAVTQYSNLSERQVEEVADVIMRRYQAAKQEWEQLKQRAEKSAGEAASAASSVAIWAFLALLVGAITAAIGGKVGEPDPREIKRTEVV
ncbi:MAG: hypothetical protein ACLFPE_07510 [Bacteroidales bacterium]